MNNMKYFFLLLAVLVSNMGFAQYPDENEVKQYDSDYNFREFPIIKDSVKKPGIYKTFEEFRSNAPSIPLQGKITPSEIKFKVKSELATLTSYKLDIPKEEAKKIGGVFGFSDGSTFYVTLNYKDPGRVNNAEFYALEYLGRYCIYDAMMISTLDNHTYHDKRTFMLDLNTGDAQLITSARLKRIIADNKELLAEFKAVGKNDEETRKAYLLRYLKAEHP
jgi:hypothetical protein